MKQLFLPILFTILLNACTDRPQQDKTAAIESEVDTSKFVYADSGQSKFTITSGDTNAGYDFKTVEVNYKLVFIAPYDNSDLKHFFAKYTTTSKSCTGCEGQERTIKVELNTFDNPQKTAHTIQQDCDDLTLDVQTYRTVKYGCCATEDQLAIYDYDNKLIIEGDSKILLGDIPNSPIKFYVAYKPEYRDTTILGTLYYCYSSSDRYAITIKSNPLPSDSCSPFSPDILIHTPSKKDKFQSDNNEYYFWSLNDIENINQINNLTLKVVYSCDEKLNIDTLSIPIINGRPFGKDDRKQIVKLRQK